MRKGTRISLGVLAIAAATAGTTPAVAGAVAAASKPETRVVGSAGAHLPGPNGPGDPVRFTVDARRSADGVSSGRFHVNHLTTDGQLFADFEGRIDCALAADGLGVVTGIIERADLPGAPPGLDLVGRRVGISVRDDRRGPDAIGWSWSTGGFEADTLPCNSAIPFLRVDQGGYQVTGNAFG